MQEVTGRCLVRMTENSLMRLGIIHPEHRWGHPVSKTQIANWRCVSLSNVSYQTIHMARDSQAQATLFDFILEGPGKVVTFQN